MIIDDKRVPTIASGNLTESFFSVKQENLAHIFSILRNQLYSDKIGAVIREYCTNAYDAHVDAGIKDTPITVIPPTRFNPSLIIRDYGKGLSEEQMYIVYSSYGESTKRETNNQVGMMGLGSKSAFAYTESFTIISYHDGFKKSYMAYIDDSGIGKISKIAEEPSDETGIEIQLSIKQNDYFRFENAIAKQLRYFNPKPNIKNDYIQDSWAISPTKIVSKPDYCIVNSNDDHLVIMGNVAYPFSIDTVSNQEYEEQIKSLTSIYSTKIHLYAEIGDVIPSASRESLDMRDKTVEWIENRLLKIYENLTADIASELDLCDSMWQVRVKYNRFNHAYQKLVENYTKDGVVLKHGYSISKDYMSYCYNGGIRKFLRCDSIKCSEYSTIYISKGDVSYASMKKRILANYNSKSTNIYAFVFDTVDEYNLFLEDTNFKGADIIDVSTLDAPKVQRLKAGDKGHGAYIYTGIGKDWAKINVNFKHDTAIYTGVDHNEAKGYGNYGIRDIKSKLENLGHHISIYGVTPCNYSKLGAGWTRLSVYVQDVLDGLPQSVRDEISHGYIKRKLDSDTARLYNEFAGLEDDPFHFKSIIDIDFNLVSTNQASNLISLTQYGFKYDFTKENEIVSKLNSVKDAFPLLKYITVNTESLPCIKDYIKAMNK